jgi:integrase
MYLRNGVYYTDFYDKNGRRCRRSLKTSDKKKAQEKERNFFFKTEEASGVVSEILLWKDFKSWYLRFLGDNKAPATQYIHTLTIRYMEEFQNPVCLRDITPEYLLEFKGFLQSKAKQNKGKPGPDRRNRIIRAVKTMMHTAEKFKKIGIKQEWAIVERDKSAKENRVVWHTIEELREIGKVLEGDLLTSFFLGWEEGLRRGEIVFLHKTDYDPINHTITICAKKNWRPKTKKSERTIPLRPASEAAIIRSIAAAAHSPYIINIPGDRNINAYLSAKYRDIARARLPHIKTFLHKLRHTYGTFLAKEGVPLKTICNLMGHSNVLQTEKYVHLGLEDYAPAVAKLPVL